MKTQSGNVLIFILIAIFLLGGLTVLVARTGGQSEDTGSSEQVSIQASEILRYAASVQTAVSRLLSSGCSESQLNFYNPVSGWVDNPNAPADKSCNVFDAAGGGITLSAPKTAWKDSAYAIYWGIHNLQCVANIGAGSATTCTKSQTELLWSLEGITLQLCNEINRSLGIASVSAAPPSDEIYTTPFDPTFPTPTGSAADMIIGNNVAAALPLAGKKAACAKDTGGTTANQYIFYYVLITR